MKINIGIIKCFIKHNFVKEKYHAYYNPEWEHDGIYGDISRFQVCTRCGRREEIFNDRWESIDFQGRISEKHIDMMFEECEKLNKKSLVSDMLGATADHLNESEDKSEN